MNDFFNPSGAPSTRSPGASLNMRNEFALIQAGFDKLPALGGNALELVRVNAAGTALESFADTFLEAADLAPYLTIASAAATYLTIASAAATYLTQASAAATYLTIANAAATYLTQANAASTYLPLAGGTLTGPLLAAVGAVGAPGIAFAGDDNTGIYSAGGDQINFSAGATLKATIDANGLTIGNVGSVSDVMFYLRAASATSRMRFHNGNGGDTALTQTSTGLEMVAATMNTTSKYTPSIKFGSADADFTTTNPKFGAAIVGYATQAYSGDTTGGMGLAFFVQQDTPGAAGALVERMLLRQDGRLYQLIGAGSGVTANATVDDIVIDSDGNAGLSILCGTNLVGQLLFGDGGSNNKGGMAYVGSAPEIRLASTIGDVMVRHSDVAASFPIGFRNLPTIGNTATATAVAVGKCYLNTAAITINNGVFAAGDIVTVYNNSAAAFNITQGTITTMRLAGTATTGTRSLAPRGFATLFFVTATEVAVSGNVT